MVKYILGFFVTLISFQAVAVENCFPKQDKSNQTLVYDPANILNANQKSALNQRLVETSNKTSNQIVVVYTDDLCGMDKAMYATELGQSWGVGRDGKDNGIVIVVKPKRAGGRGEVFIAPGYGLEGVIPDATAKLVVDNEMIPFFKKNDYYQGVNAALDMLIPLAVGEFNSQQYQQHVSQQKGKPTSYIGLIIVFIIFFIISKFTTARNYASRNNMSFWSAFWMGSMLSGGGIGGSHRGGFSNFTGGGGGFGGFGGGGFGGGGAGGSW